MMDMTEILKVAPNARLEEHPHVAGMFDVYLGNVQIGAILRLDAGRSWAITDCDGSDQGRVDGGAHHAVAEMVHGDPNATEKGR